MYLDDGVPRRKLPPELVLSDVIHGHLGHHASLAAAGGHDRIHQHHALVVAVVEGADTTRVDFNGAPTSSKQAKTEEGVSSSTVSSCWQKK